MLALVKNAKGIQNFGLQDIEVPDLKEDEILIEVKCAGLCGTDLHVLNDNYPANLPVVMGHEFSGIVKEVGCNVDKKIIGRKIVSEPFFRTCGSCYLCASGNYNLCDGKIALGSKADGAFARYIKVNKDRIHLLPDEIDYEEACLLEPLSCSVHGVLYSINIKPADVVVILGTGPIGILSAYLSKLCGGKVILGGTRYSIRTEVAREKLKIDYVLDIKKVDIFNFLSKEMSITNADIVIECSGSREAVINALKLVKKRGKILQMGIFDKDISVPFDLITQKEILVVGSFGSNNTAWLKAIELLKHKKISIKEVITHRFSLRDYKEAFEFLKNGSGIKIIFNDFN